MALKHLIELPSGATASLWEITGIVWTDTAGQIVLSGWLNEKTHSANKPPVEKRAIMTLSDADFKKITKKIGAEFPSKRQLYDFVKTQKDWVGAVEV